LLNQVTYKHQWHGCFIFSRTTCLSGIG